MNEYYAYHWFDWITIVVIIVAVIVLAIRNDEIQMMSNSQKRDEVLVIGGVLISGICSLLLIWWIT